MPNILRDAGCEFYSPGDAGGLAAAIERVAGADRDTLVRRNLTLAEGWGYDRAVAGIMAALATPRDHAADGVTQGRVRPSPSGRLFPESPSASPAP